MKPILTRDKIEVKKSAIAGRGVFARAQFRPGEMIEKCVILESGSRDPLLNDYYFLSQKKIFLALGCGSLYNHADQPNAKAVFDLENECMEVVAKDFIEPGDEICISYGTDWFSSRCLIAKSPTIYYRLKRQLRKHVKILRLIFVGTMFWLFIYLGQYVLAFIY